MVNESHQAGRIADRDDGQDKAIKHQRKSRYTGAVQEGDPPENLPKEAEHQAADDGSQDRSSSSDDDTQHRKEHKIRYSEHDVRDDIEHKLSIECSTEGREKGGYHKERQLDMKRVDS